MCRVSLLRGDHSVAQDLRCTLCGECTACKLSPGQLFGWRIKLLYMA